MSVLKKRAADVDVDHCDPGDEDAFYVADMGEIYRQHLRWKLNLGRVKPFYGKPRSTGWHLVNQELTFHKQRSNATRIRRCCV